MNEAIRPSTPINQVEEEIQAEVEEKQILNDEKRLATVVSHPGWAEFESMLREDIEKFRTGKNVNFKTLSDNELGQIIRVEHMVADRLEAYLSKVYDTERSVREGGEE